MKETKDQMIKKLQMEVEQLKKDAFEWEAAFKELKDMLKPYRSEESLHRVFPERDDEPAKVTLQRLITQRIAYQQESSTRLSEIQRLYNLMEVEITRTRKELPKHGVTAKSPFEVS